LRAIKAYAGYTSNYEMEMAANELLGARYAAQYKLKDFKDVASEDVKNLSLKGIKTVKQMLDAGSTKKDRKTLAKETGVPYEIILELVKLPDLARIPGLRKVRARLYYDAGLDTVEKIADCDPADLIKTLAGFIEKTGFDGIAPLQKEAATAVATAKYIPKIVEY
jgi:hypothetical protein